MTLKTGLSRVGASKAAMAEVGQHRALGDAKSEFTALERAHLLGQLDLFPHLRVRWQVLGVGWSTGDWREVTGQVVRIALVPIGHLFRRLPVGNTGGTNVSAFKPIDIAPELKRLLDSRDQ